LTFCCCEENMAQKIAVELAIPTKFTWTESNGNTEITLSFGEALLAEGTIGRKRVICIGYVELQLAGASVGFVAPDDLTDVKHMRAGNSTHFMAAIIGKTFSLDAGEYILSGEIVDVSLAVE